jgi:filamentous hemagglutinin family protein
MHKHATMNRYYRLVWSHVHACWVAVAEGARGHGKGGARRRKATLLAALAAAGVAGAGAAYAAPPATALPTGGQVAAGQAQISTSGSQMTINQATSQAILNWNTFDIGAQASVKFQQPSASAVALNRVQSANPSQIYGKLDANGQVFLVNPNGVLFAPGAQVNVGGLVASSLDLADRDFLARSYSFAGDGGGAVRNEGSITAAPGGYVALLGPSVANSGSIGAPQGSVALAAGQQIGVDLRGDGLITVRTSRGALNALAENKGLIQAAGGQVLLSASAADALARAGVNNTGLVQAGGLSTKGGSIRLVADGGDVQAGALDASSQGAQGGSIAVSGMGISLGGAIAADGKRGGSVSVTAAGQLASGGAVSAQGTDGNGGSISYRAGGVLTETSGATANAGGTQHGGSIAAQADGGLITSGSYSARGGAGNGGRIDLSGGTVSLLSARADASGEQQGGLVRVGGAFQGGAAQGAGTDARFVKRWGHTAAIASAERTFINDSSAIDVSARGAAGHGGTAVVWSDKQTTVLGRVDARGGADGGAGGAVEVSSHGDLRYLALDGIQAGAGGALLLDPKNLVIGDFNYAYTWTAEAILGSGYSGGKNASVAGLASGDSFGSAVALSSDSTVLAVGAPMDAGTGAATGIARGSVRVFGFSDGNFSGAALKSTIGLGYAGTNDTNLTLADGALFGSSVALNAAGTKLAVGAVGENNGAGSVRLFDLNATTTKATLQTTLTAGAGGFGGGAYAQQFGTAVALNGDGTKLAVGAVNDGGAGNSCTSCGAVYLFNNAVLGTTIGSGYASAFSLAQNAQFGSAVALNAAGDKLAVGAVGVDDLKGAVYVFGTTASSASLAATYSSSATSNGTSLNVNLSSNELFGSSLAFNAAGTRLAIGSPSTGGAADAGLGPGSVRLIDTTSGSPVLRAVLRRGLRLGDGSFHTTPDYSGFGYALALNGAGDRLVVGAPYANSASDSIEGAGAVYGYALANPVYTGVNYTDATGLNVGIDASSLAQQIINGTSVTLRASNDLLVNSAVLASTGSGRGALVLEAGRSLAVNANISTGGGNLSLLANASDAAVVAADRDAGSAALTVASGAAIDTGAGTAALAIGTGYHAGRDASGDIQVDGTVRGRQISLINSGKTAGSDVRVAGTGRLVGTDTSGTSVLVAAAGAGGGTFYSSAGASTISTVAGGRYLVYSDNPTNTAEGMSGYSKHYNQAYSGTAPAYAASGSWFLYSVAPVLTVTANSGVTKVYDGLAMGNIGYASVSGLIDGDANGALTGSLSGASGKNVGTYAVQLGTLASSLGYTIAVAPRNYTITARTLTATATGNNKVYDALTGATVSFGDNRISGDALTLNGTAAFTSKGVGTGKTINVSGITLSGADAANYTLGNATATTTGNITARTLHATAGNVNKVYDGQTGVASMAGVLGDDRVAGDTLTLSGSGNYDDKNAGSGKTVTYTGLGLSGGDAANYVLDSATITGAGAITQRALTATASGVSKVYDGSATATATLGDNRVSGDVLTLASTGAGYADKNAGNGKTITVNGISLSGTDAANYTLASTTATGTGDITKRTLTASATGVDKVYDGLTVATVTLGDDRVAGDVFTLSGTGAFGDKNAGSARTVSVSGIAVSGTDAANYTLAATTASTAASISQRTLIASAVGVNKVYDGLTTATATLADNRVAGDALTLTGGSASFADKNAGNGKTVTVEGVTLGGTDAANYTLASTTAAGTANITRRTLAASATGIDKVYDGSTAATVTLGDDRVNGDVLALNGSAAFGDKNVGNGKAVGVTGIALSGADASNYTLSATAASTTAAITPRALAASATGIDKVYDGQTAATVTLGDNRVSGDVLTLTSTGAAFADKNAGGGKAVSVSGIALSGTDAANYSLSNTTASTSATIAQRMLNASATASGKVYDGQTAASATLGDDRVAGDVLTLGSTGAAFADKNAGTGKTVTVNGITVSGTDAANYTLASGTATTTADIAKRTLTASTGSVTKVYDGLAAATISLSDDRVAGDVLTTSGSAVYSDKNVGTGKTVTVNGIALSGTDAANYTLASTSASNSNGSITARTLHAGTTGGGKVYDGLASSNATLTDDRVAGDALTLTGGAASFADKNAGTGKTVTIGGLALSGADKNNYVLASDSATGTADITARMLTASATAVDKVYDGSLLASVNYGDNRVAGDVLAIGGTATFADKNVGAAKNVSITGMTLSGADALNYTLASATASSNASITPRQLTVAASAGNKVYDGSAAATAGLSDNRVAGDVLTLASTGAAFADKNAGTGKTVTVSGISFSGTDFGNYTLASTSATASADIAQRVLNASAAAGNKVYNGSAAATVTLSDDRVSGDVLTLSNASAAFADKNVGSAKTVTVNGLVISGTDAANYTLASSSATASADITARVLNVAGGSVSKVYDGLLTGQAALSGDAVAGDVLNITGTAAFTDKNAGTGKTVNVSGIALSGADAANYTLASTSLATTGSIAKRALTATATGSTKVYDGNLTAAVTLADNRVTGDDLALAGSGSYADKNAGAGKTITVGGITLSGADAGNYTMAAGTVQTTGAITARTLNATATGQSKVYDGTLTAGVTFASDALAGDAVTLAGQAAFTDKNAGNGKAVSVSGVTLSGADAGNYVLGAAPAATTASITQRALSVTASASSKVYDGNTSASVSLSDNRIAGDQLALTSSGGTFADKNAGTKSVSVSGIAVSGADAGNYALTSTTASGSGTITQRTLNASATVSTKVYDGGTTATVTLGDDRIAGDSLSVASGAASFADKNAGSGKAVSVTGLTLAGADAGNYALASNAASATGTITQRALNASAANVTKVYDGSTSATVVLSDDRVAGDALQVSGQGSFSDANAGTGKKVNITGLALSGADAANYTFAGGSASGSGTITQRALQATIGGTTVKAYDGTTGAVLNPGAVTLTGFVAGQGATLQAGSTGQYNDANVAGATTVSTALSAASFSASSGTLLSNYLLPTVATGAGAITARSVSVTGMQAATKVYDGSTAATLSSRGTLAGLVAGQSLTLNGPSTGVFDTRSAGTGKTVTASGYSLADGAGGKASNYALASTTATGTGTISQATLSVVVDDKSRVQGTTNPVFTASVSGLVGGDTRDVLGNLVFNTSATTQSAAGQYAVTASGAAPNDYRVFFLDGVLTVTSAGVQPGQFDPVAAIVNSVNPVAATAQGFGSGSFGAASGGNSPQALLAAAREENKASSPGNGGGNNGGNGGNNAGAPAPANDVTFVNGNSKIVSRNGGVRNLE